MRAFALQVVCSVAKPVTPGRKFIVISSFAGAPTVNDGASEPIPAPVLLTPTK
jgi:hypothetical protein